MFNRILVALDMSAAAEPVFERGLSLAQHYQASLHLLHVLSAEEETSPMPIPLDLGEMYPASGNELTMELWQEQWQNFENQGLELLRQRCDQATQSGLKADFQQILGSPGKTICHQAQQLEAEIIVVGHRGRWGLGEILLGSVSNYVFHHAPCCVLVVPTPDL
jgi:nucleotide-binding universal stress UspA family protein